MTILTCVLEKKWLKFIGIVLEKEFSFEKESIACESIGQERNNLFYHERTVYFARGKRRESFLLWK
jgi:hypothetical protein